MILNLFMTVPKKINILKTGTLKKLLNFTKNRVNCF